MSTHLSTSTGHRINRKLASEILEISLRTLDRYIDSKRLVADKSNGRVWLDEDEVLRLRDELIGGCDIHLADHTRTHRDIAENSEVSMRNLTNSVSTHLSTPLSTSVYSSKGKNAKISTVRKVMHNDRLEDDGVIATLLHMYGQQLDNVVKVENVPSSVSESMQNMGWGNIVQTELSQPYFHQMDSTPRPLLNYYSEGVYQKLYEELKSDHEVAQKKIEIAHYKVGRLEEQLKALAESTIPMLEYKKSREEAHAQTQSLRVEVEKRDLTLRKVRTMLHSERLNKWVFAGLVFLLLALQPVFWYFARG